MRFARTTEQAAFAAALDDLLSAADVPATARAWARGDHGPGLDLWARLAALGAAGLAVPEAHGGLAASMTDVTVAFEAIGHHAVPGPWLETAVVAPTLLDAVGDPDGLLPGVVDGKMCLAVAAPPLAPYAIDTAAATRSFLVQDGTLWTAAVAAEYESVDAARHPARLEPRTAAGTVEQYTLDRAGDLAATACAAQLIGCGERVLAETVRYVAVRKQFGRAVGEYQAVKHLLADVRVALDFAAPLVHGAALALDAGSPTAQRAVSAAKVAAGDAAYLAARTALQVHGAVGYTLEHDLSLWFTKIRALLGAWGTHSWHRGRILRHLVGGEPCASH
ncbi:acyl-CoA dehydrogenase family protein [Streptomyces mirabilis]|uniref:acyl-CoA dehydrogenase family protein n=1 Tax=Streptomyces mirabilis TaxID=68239 RepID=UPI0033BB3D7E